MDEKYACMRSLSLYLYELGRAQRRAMLFIIHNAIKEQRLKQILANQANTN